MRAAIYCRVSTERQEIEGTSLQTQLAACRAHCQHQGYEVVGEFIGGNESGLTLERPKLEELRHLARSGQIQRIVFYDVDRYSRNADNGVMLYTELRQLGVAIEAVTCDIDTKTPMGKFSLYARMIMAETEAEKIKERTVRGRRARAKAGKLTTGGPLYGYKYTRGKGIGQGVRTPKPEESQWVQQIFRWCAEDKLSLIDIANRLNQLCIPTPRGKQHWAWSTVRDILRNPAYMGKTYRFAETFVGHKRVRRPQEEWIEVPGATPPIIPEDLFRAVQAILTANKQQAKRNTHESYLLRGFVECSRCGHHYWGAVSTTRTPKGAYRTRYYHCGGNTNTAAVRCKNSNVNADGLEAQVWAEVEKIITSPKEWLAELAARREDSQKALIEADLERIRAQYKIAQRHYEKDLNIYKNDGYTEAEVKVIIAQWHTDSQQYEKQKAALEAELNRISSLDVSMQNAEELCRRIKEHHQGRELSDAEKREALEALGVKVLVDGDNVSVTGRITEPILSVATSTS